MKNREKYRFADFTLTNYQRLLKLAIEQGYTFSNYTSEADKRRLIWRHDVEFSVHRALKMAKIEYKLGIKAHYFVQIHSEFYNIFEREIYELLIQIRDLGHYIGLHFDSQFWQVKSKEQLESGLQKDKILLEELLKINVRSFSFHNTTPDLLSLDEQQYAGLINVYAKKIRDMYSYCTDSTGFWRYERLEDVLQDVSIKHLQVLTHDGMWQDDIMAPRQRVKRCIDMRAKRIMELYDRFIPIFGQENVDND